MIATLENLVSHFERSLNARCLEVQHDEASLYITLIPQQHDETFINVLRATLASQRLVAMSVETPASGVGVTIVISPLIDMTLEYLANIAYKDVTRTYPFT